MFLQKFLYVDFHVGDLFSAAYFVISGDFVFSIHLNVSIQSDAVFEVELSAIYEFIIANSIQRYDDIRNTAFTHSESLECELGHEWYTYHLDRREDGCSLSPSTREFYLNGKFKNPVVNVLAQFGGMYDDISCYDSGFYYELGFNKEFALCDELTLGFDWGITLGDADYLYFIYDEDVKEGFAGTTAKAYLTWSITEWMSLTGSIAYTGTMNSDARDAQSSDDKDILWGGFRLSFSY